MSETVKRKLQIRHNGIHIKVVDKETQQEIEGLIPESVEINHYTYPHETPFGATWVTAKVTFMIVDEEDITIFPKIVDSGETTKLLILPEKQEG